ncbi:Alpha/Beta hydrolase protein [Xylariales sp. PMI_506]|nr:Alpha/Beta hydrolase protein [Xylariales sp. PMI_506]
MRMNHFHYELLRNLSHARYSGADVGEVLEAASALRDYDIESFYEAFNELAERVYGQAEGINSGKYPVSARDAFFRASTYFRAADFYLHGDAADPRLVDLWAKQITAFNRAIALIPEEMLHVLGSACLERGINVMTYEGPGQPTVVREQKLGFIPEWEKVVTPVVDYLVGQPEVDTAKIGLMGCSMGGWLAVRAASFEHCLAVVMAVDGVFNVHQAYYNQIPPPMRAAYDMIDAVLALGKAPIAFKWGVQHGVWSFCADSQTKPFTLDGVAHLVQCPAWVGEAADDIFFKDQPELTAKAIGSNVPFKSLTKADGASNHCHVGATTYLNQILLDWFDEVTSKSI